MPCLAEIYEPRSDMSLETAKTEGGGHCSFWMWWRAAGWPFPSICVPAAAQLPERCLQLQVLGSSLVFLAFFHW